MTDMYYFWYQSKWQPRNLCGLEEAIFTTAINTFAWFLRLFLPFTVAGCLPSMRFLHLLLIASITKLATAEFQTPSTWEVYLVFFELPPILIDIREKILLYPLGTAKRPSTPPLRRCLTMEPASHHCPFRLTLITRSFFIIVSTDFFSILAVYDFYTNQTLFEDPVTTFFSNYTLETNPLWASHLYSHAAPPILTFPSSVRFRYPSRYYRLRTSFEQTSLPMCVVLSLPTTFFWIVWCLDSKASTQCARTKSTKIR